MPEQGIEEMHLALEGFLISFVGSLIVYLVFRGGVGGGDVKLFAVLGYCYGTGQILYLIFWTFFFAAIANIFLMIKKKKLIKKQTMPLAPFALWAVLLQMVGGRT
jgi:Flp pilus assembly protein protease CpaA